MRDNCAVLLMAYGTPTTEHEIEPYLTDIRHGRKPLPSEVEDLKNRYQKIGGNSPLLDITKSQASQLEQKLRSNGTNVRVYVGMKHWHPFIRETVSKIITAGYDRIIAMVLAPHYSKMSIGGYKQALDNAAESTYVKFDFIESWHSHPLLHKAIVDRISEALRVMPSRDVHLLFTAHSLPERIIKENDPYPDQLLESCQAVANLVKTHDWSFAYQSAGSTGEKWLGPDILEALEDLSSRTKCKHVLVVPIGFVADHLEILYDIDVETQEFANSHGIVLRRTQSLNTHPTLIAALADLVTSRIQAF